MSAAPRVDGYVAQIAEQVVALNDSHLAQQLTRVEWALAIQEINEALTRNGYTWDDVSAAAAAAVKA